MHKRSSMQAQNCKNTGISYLCNQSNSTTQSTVGSLQCVTSVGFTSLLKTALHKSDDINFSWDFFYIKQH